MAMQHPVMILRQEAQLCHFREDYKAVHIHQKNPNQTDIAHIEMGRGAHKYQAQLGTQL